MKTGFIYLWRDSEKNKYYVGSHIGSIDDGYTGSGHIFSPAYKKRPHAFKRRILENNIPQDQIKEREEHWLSMIDDQELGVRYYNLKKVAFGGDIVSTLSEEAREQHRIKSGIASRKFWDNISEEEKFKKMSRSGKIRRSKVENVERPSCRKEAEVYTSTGEKIDIESVFDFCKKNNLNYGNFKTMLRGERKSCGGYMGAYV